ncbi:MAG: hypothetical protein MH252_13240 [Thermosynechococcaceae cyanobacterium MS004]|nr:hypothetical protein [Thermosynechococcaceae cyanobacterium MS004]
MSIENRLRTTAKNIEGKIQKAVGEVTDNPKDKLDGQVKQSESKFVTLKFVTLNFTTLKFATLLKAPKTASKKSSIDLCAICAFF